MERFENVMASYCKTSGISALASSCRAVVVGFSGGADSALLLTLLARGALGLTVAAAHLDHGIRGKEAKRDRDFCREFCRKRNIRFFEEERDVPSLAKDSGEGVEERGRKERYSFFDKCRKELARELSCDVSEVLVATAHNADDNLETVVFNLARGAALRGLRGILPVRDAVYIRPLLCFTSKEIRDICAEEEIPYVVDSTNLDDSYTRNRIRHLVIPELEKINPSVQKTALAMCSALSADAEYLDSLAASEAEEVSRERLLGLPRALSSRIVSSAFSEESDETLSSVHLGAIFDALASGKSGRLHLPDSVTLYYGDGIEFVRERDKNEKCDYRFEAAYGEHGMKEYGFSVGFYAGEASFEKDYPNIYKELIYKIGINDTIIDNLFVRNRKESDVYYLRGHHRKLKKLMCDAKIPRHLRDRLPVVCDGEGIVWVPGFPVRDGLSAKDEKDVGLIITYSKLKEADLNERQR